MVDFETACKIMSAALIITWGAICIAWALGG